MNIIFIGVDDEDMKYEILKHHEDAVAIIKKELPTVYEEVGDICVNLSKTLRTNGGWALTKERKILFNYRLHKDHWEEIGKTYIHELAHIVSDVWYGRGTGHGPMWKKTMELLGQEPEICHSMKTRAYARPQKRWIYKCECTVHRVSTTKHNRIKKGENYICRGCGERLVKKGRY